MALVEIFHVVATEWAVDSTSNEIKEGMLVALTTLGVRRVQAGDAMAVFGVAGDSKSTTASYMPGVYAGWQNRVSDYYDETRASGKLTVYNGGGQFATDQYVASGDLIAANIGHYLIADVATGKLAYGGPNPHTLLNAGTPPVAMFLQVPGSYPSGVPGTDINGDMALRGENTNQYLVFKLLV